jgi:hypothetical protein
MKYDRMKKKHKLRHLIRRSRHREWLLSNLMRPNELVIVMLSPLFFALHSLLQLRRYLGVFSGFRSSGSWRQQ